jgi:multidrug efflux pump subunit AcrB
MNQQKQTGWLAWFARNPVAANLLMVTLLVVGIINALDMRTEGFPTVDPNQVMISVDFEGGSPEVVEEGVAAKIEEALQGVGGIKNITSSVTANKATVVVEGVDTYPIDVLKDDVKIRVDAISTFSEQVQNVVVQQQLEERSVISVQVFGDTQHSTLKEVAHKVRTRLLALPKVSKVDFVGMRDFEITIEVNEEKLRAYQLSFEEVAIAIQNASVNLSAGELKSSAGVISLRGRYQRYHGQEFHNILLRTSNAGSLVVLEDIAIVKDSYTDLAVLSEFNGKPSINLDVILIGKDSITTASDSVQQEIKTIQSENWLPENISVVTWADEAKNIRDSLSLLSMNALMGIVLVLVVLALFLDLKVAFFVAIGIPIAFSGALMIMGPSYLNYSINNLTIFAFIIVLGIVVDDAIVIAENIYTQKKREGEKADVETAIRAAKEVATPATFGVLTTVAAFYPLTTISGNFGGPFRVIAVVVILCLLFSLIESKFILPAHLAKLKFSDKSTDKKNVLARLWSGLQNYIDKVLTHFTHHRFKTLLSTAVRYRYQSICVFVAMFILSIGLVTGGLVKSVFFTEWEAGVVYANVKTHPGTPANETQHIARLMSQALEQLSDELKVEFAMDISPVEYVYSHSIDDETATLKAQLVSNKARDFPSSELLRRWREKTQFISGIKQQEFYAGFQTGEDILLEITSPDVDSAEAVTRELISKVSDYSGVFDLVSNLDSQRPELAITLKPEARLLGFSEREVIEQLRAAIFGYEAQRVQRGNEEVRVKVRYPLSERNSISDLELVRIRTTDNGTVPLDNVVELSHDMKQSVLDRKNGKRILTLKANVDEEVISSGEIIADLNNLVFPDLLARYPGVNIHIGGEGEAEGEAIVKLISGFILGLLIIYALLAIPLKSYSKPFVIMACIPFGIIGAIWGHMIIGIAFNILSFFGVLALSGVVVNDSLVLVSRYNQKRGFGMSYEEAVIDAGVTRFRAILLTSITTFVGLSPLIMESAEQAQMLIPMAVSLAFGILFATVITLLLVPVLLGIHEDLKALFSTALKKSPPDLVEL